MKWTAIIVLMISSAISLNSRDKVPGFEESCRIIMERITAEYLSKIKDIGILDETVSEHMAYINPDGSFSDIDYASRARTNWPAQEHLARMDEMVQAYIAKGGQHYGDDRLHGMIVTMLGFWYDKNPVSDNWWYNQIGAPRVLGLALVAMRSGVEKIPETLEKKILDRLAELGGNPSDTNRTGANKADIALHWMYRGCLLSDEKILDTAIKEAFYPASCSTGEGIQFDGSYFQHHEQLYIGGYSTVLINRIADIAWYTIGTRYALSQKQLDILNSYIVRTYLGMTRGNTIAFNTIGRSISRRGALSQGSSIGWLKKMAAIDSKRAWQYEDGISTIYGKSKVPVILPQVFSHYYIGDYSMYMDNQWSFGVRMVSSRTYRSEELNGENKKGYFISDGSTSINVTGQEYTDIFPSWDWNKIPGTTAPQKTIPSMDGIWTHRGESVFTGGVSNGKTGVSVYTMDNHEDGVDIAADKAWFFFGNEVLCIGNGITSDMDEDIATTLNQCRTGGHATWSSGGTETDMGLGDSISDKEIEWIIHDNICYYFPDTQKVSAKLETRAGSWKEINDTQSEASVINDVFTVWISHGTKPEKAEYSYIIVPGIGTGAKARSYDTGKIRIIENSDDIQAAYHTRLKTGMMIFHKAGSIDIEGKTVSTDKPCIVMTDSRHIYLSDPSHTLDKVTVTINSPDGKSRQYGFDLSQDGVRKGITHKKEL